MTNTHLLPYILANHLHYNGKYSAYIPFLSTDPHFSTGASPSITEYLELPTNIELNTVWFENMRPNQKYKICIFDTRIEDLVDKVRLIQHQLKKKQNTVNDESCTIGDLLQRGKRLIEYKFLLPYMYDYSEKDHDYSAYIPFISVDPSFSTFTSIAAAAYLGLPTDRQYYHVSYFHSFDSDHEYEIGLYGKEKEKTAEAVREIQDKLKRKGCVVNENFISAEDLLLRGRQLLDEENNIKF